MKIIRWANPMNELLGLSNTFKNFLSDDFLKNRENACDFIPAVEVYEEADKWRLSAELPGIKKDDIKIELEDGLLKISGVCEDKKEKKENNYYYSERKYGSFIRTFEVPENVNPSEIAAEYNEGILNVTIPKAEKPKETKKIEIK